MLEDLSMYTAFAKLFIFRWLNAVFTRLRNVLWCVKGTEWRLKRDRAIFERSAHRLTIWFKHSVDMLYGVDLRNFVLTHDCSLHPEYVLKDEVTLLQLTATDAIFVESDASMPPPFCNAYSFILYGQFQTGRKIITMPISSLLQLCKAMPPTEAKLIFLYNHARCGSTLLTSIFDHTERTVSYNEPRALDSACRLAYNAWDSDTSREVIRSVIRMYAKPYGGYKEAPMAYIVKHCVTNMAFAQDFHALFPEALNLFIYRDSTASALSTRRVAEFMPSVKLMIRLLNVRIAFLSCFLMKILGLAGDMFRSWAPKFSADLELNYHLSALCYHYYNTLRDQGIPITGIRYEDLCRHPETMIRKILKLAEFPEMFLPLAAKAMDTDSQYAMPFSRKVTKHLRSRIEDDHWPSADLLDHIQQECQSMGVPGPKDWKDLNLRLPGSIEP